MRPFYLAGILAILVAVLIACGSGDGSLSLRDTEPPEAVQATRAPDLATSEGVEVAAPLSTVEPAQERPYRSYPAPTGYPGFRVYYQKRCYPGCHSYEAAYAQTEPVQAEPTAIPTVGRERPYRPYPAPTGYPGFRVYYQKRCYPGCHYGASTPEPAVVHP